MNSTNQSYPGDEEMLVGFASKDKQFSHSNEADRIIIVGAGGIADGHKAKWRYRL
ncbi:MAG TPA: hypothetical protein VI524_07680 [Anaerolineales bacterium]|nr:hypothetical protein [Anaerolineales bacterium]